MTATRKAAAVVVAAAVSLGSATPTGQAPTPAPKPLVPAAASSIAAQPAQFYGQIVTVFATVDRIVSPTSFTIDQDATRQGAGEVLVVAATLSAPVTVNSYVTVIGEVFPQDGKPAIRATSVVDAKMVDLARRIPPPMTAEEEAFDRVMKRIQPAFASLRQALTESNADAAKKHAAELKVAFTDTEAFWKVRGKPDALKWAADARVASDTSERAVGAGNWDDARTAAAALQQTCSACHAAYRERLDDGSYRIK